MKHLQTNEWVVHVFLLNRFSLLSARPHFRGDIGQRYSVFSVPQSQTCGHNCPLTKKCMRKNKRISMNIDRSYE